jgi:hypothetical protein
VFGHSPISPFLGGVARISRRLISRHVRHRSSRWIARLNTVDSILHKCGDGFDICSFWGICTSKASLWCIGPCDMNLHTEERKSVWERVYERVCVWGGANIKVSTRPNSWFIFTAWLPHYRKIFYLSFSINIKTVPEDKMVQDLILCTRLCGTGFITQHGWVVHFHQTNMFRRKRIVPTRFQHWGISAGPALQYFGMIQRGGRVHRLICEEYNLFDNNRKGC